MDTGERLRDQIERSAKRLAQLKAREMIHAHRVSSRAKEAEKRADAKLKMTLGAMLVDAGIARMEPAEILGALFSYRDLVKDPATRERYTKRGAAWLDAQKPRASTQLH